MSLFARTARNLIVGALLMASVGAVGLRYFIHWQIRREVSAQLRHDWRRLAIHLRKLPPPLTESSGLLNNWQAMPVAGTLNLRPTFSDTTEQDPITGEPILVGLLKQTATVGGQHYLFTLRQPYEEFDEIAENVTASVVVCFLGLVLLLVLIELALYRRIWRPFYAILNQLRSYHLDQSGASPFKTGAIREFNRLSDSLNQMADSLRRQYYLQKQFTENAAHELQTPLTIAMTELEQLEQSERLSEADWVHLDRASQALARLTNLSRALLLLTKIETRQYSEAEPVDLARLLHQLIDTYEDFARHRNMGLESQIAPDVVVQMNRQLAEVMLANLLKNAIRHGEPGQPIRVSLTRRQLSFVNAGDPLPFPPSQLFERFVKNAAKPDSTGLGLALVKQIADRYNLRVHYAYHEPDRSHRFELDLVAVGNPLADTYTPLQEGTTSLPVRHVS